MGKVQKRVMLAERNERSKQRKQVSDYSTKDVTVKFQRTFILTINNDSPEKHCTFC
jgi:hypothetical protein